MLQNYTNEDAKKIQKMTCESENLRMAAHSLHFFKTAWLQALNGIFWYLPVQNAKQPLTAIRFFATERWYAKKDKE